MRMTILRMSVPQLLLLRTILKKNTPWVDLPKVVRDKEKNFGDSIVSSHNSLKNNASTNVSLENKTEQVTSWVYQGGRNINESKERSC